MAKTIVSDKKNRSVSKRNQRERGIEAAKVREKKNGSTPDVTIALLIVYLIDQLSCFISALFSVNQLVHIFIFM